jgi:hypothetical protein
VTAVTTSYRPNGTQTNNGWTLTGGQPTPYQTLNDNSDTTFATAPTTPQNQLLSLSMANMTTPASTEYIRAVRLAARAAQIGSSIADYLGAAFKQLNLDGSYTRVKNNSFYVNNTAFTTYLGGWKYADAYGNEWSETVVDTLVCDLACQFGSSSSAIQIKVADIWLDVQVAKRPVVSTIVPSGGTLTTQVPTVTFNVTQEDGVPISHYQVKVFAYNVYTGGGFDAGTSTSLWNSGVVTFNGTGGLDPVSANVNVPLANDIVTGYIVVARTAVLTDEGDNTIWGAWTAGTQFFVNADPILDPIFTGIAHTVSGAPATDLMLQSKINHLDVDGADFEAASDGDWAAATGNTTLAVVSSPAGSHGTKCLDVFSTLGTQNIGISTPGFAFGPYRVVPATDLSGTSLELKTTAKVRAGTTGRVATVSYFWYTEIGFISTSTSTGVTDASGSWTLLTHTAVPPPTATRVQIAINWASAPVNEHHYVDEIAITAGSATWSKGGRFNTLMYFVIQKYNHRTQVYEDWYSNPMVGALENTLQYRKVTDYAHPVGAQTDYRARMEYYAIDGSLVSTSNWINLTVPAISPVPSGFWITPLDATATPIAVSLVGETFDTQHWEESSEYHPLKRKDPVYVSDGDKLHKRSFVIEVTNIADAARIRKILQTSGAAGFFYLTGGWPDVTYAKYRVSGQKITEHVENTSPLNLWTFEIDAQCVEEYS